MSVISLTSLKGGVGKTSLSINLAHAFASEGCQILLIDCDPAAHASRFLRQDACSLMAKFFHYEGLEDEKSILDKAISADLPLVRPVRKNLDLIVGGPELRNFYWGNAAVKFKNLFQRFLSEMKNVYDYIIIDTAPDFNILTRNAIAASQVSIVPVDNSEMGIFGLEEILKNAAHIDGPTWAIARSMVPKQASRIQKLAEDNLRDKVNVSSTAEIDEDDEEFFELVEEFETTVPENSSPVYLLDAKIYRTEKMNKLSFSGQTAFDLKSTAPQAEQYKILAREVEFLIEMNEGRELELDVNSFAAVKEEEGQQVVAA